MHFIKNLKEPIIALATATGVAAISVIRISGTQIIPLFQPFFLGKNPEKFKSHSIYLGFIIDENGKKLDQVLVSFFKSPKSYTKEDVIEISCHGSPFIVQEIISLFLRNGIRLAQKGEFTLRAFLNGQMDLSQAEAVADLIAANSEKSVQLALDQMRGGFSKEISLLREELIHFASLIELELDFGEEDVEFANRADLEILVQKLLTKINALKSSFQWGNVIKNGVQTALIGRPNAGKSTLLNALLNEERAIVSEIPGTTRDTIEELIHIDGIPFRFIDTAGIRNAEDQIEALGIEKTREKIATAQLLIYLFDAELVSMDEVQKDLSALSLEGKSILVVANKIDLTELASDYIREGIMGISAKEKIKIDSLKQKIFDLVLSDIPEQDQTVISNLRHYEALSLAEQALSQVENGLHNARSGDFLAMDIRHALAYLGQITGEVGVEDLLEHIFSKFCIGK